MLELGVGIARGDFIVWNKFVMICNTLYLNHRILTFFLEAYVFEGSMTCLIFRLCDADSTVGELFVLARLLLFDSGDLQDL